MNLAQMLSKPKRFNLGKVVGTPGSIAAINKADADRSPLGDGSYNTFTSLLIRHASGDWGDMDPEDCAQNDAAILSGDRLMSAYTLPDGTRIWIITESDRSVTTFLLPEEY